MPTILKAILSLDSKEMILWAHSVMASTKLTNKNVLYEVQMLDQSWLWLDMLISIIPMPSAEMKSSEREWLLTPIKTVTVAAISGCADVRGMCYVM